MLHDFTNTLLLLFCQTLCNCNTFRVKAYCNMSTGQCGIGCKFLQIDINLILNHSEIIKLSLHFLVYNIMLYFNSDVIKAISFNVVYILYIHVYQTVLSFVLCIPAFRVPGVVMFKHVLCYNYKYR